MHFLFFIIFSYIFTKEWANIKDLSMAFKFACKHEASFDWIKNNLITSQEL